MIFDVGAYTDVALKLSLAVLFSGIIGFEREIHGRAAGLRTHILVAVGACFIMWISTNISLIYKDIATVDPGRIAAGVVTGIGFLGAGTILRDRSSVIGLTTAASIWAVSAIGLGVGVGFYAESFIATIVVFLTLYLVSKIEYLVVRKVLFKVLIVEGRIDAGVLQNIKESLQRNKAILKNFEIEKICGKDISSLMFDIKLTSIQDSDNILVDISALDGVERSRWD